MGSPLKRLEKSKYMLLALHDSNNRLRKAILSVCDKSLIQTICEVAYNTLKGNHSICSKAKKNLEPYKKILRRLSCPKKTIESKRHILVQSGGAIITSLLGSIVAGLISQYISSKLAK